MEDRECVALLRCEGYAVDRIEAAFREGFALLGGDAWVRSLIPPGSHVLLKPNLLSPEPRESLVVTDHRFFEAAVRVLTDYAAGISFGDSPGFGGGRAAAASAGLLAVARRYGVRYCEFDRGEERTLPGALQVPSMEVAAAVREADVLISLPRIKTHGMTLYTGAIKNQFGCVPGLRKAAWHGRLPRTRDFSRMLLDVNRLVGTRFAFLDGIVAMEGNGPKNGDPRALHAVIMGESLSAVDSLAARLIGHDPLEIPYLREAHRSGWGPVLAQEYTVLGEEPDSLQAADFVRVRGKGPMGFGVSGGARALLSRLVAPRPELVPGRCIGCRQCLRICPEEDRVLSFSPPEGRGVPSWDYRACIRCFCCQEVCPAGAIRIGYPLLARWLGWEET